MLKNAEEIKKAVANVAEGRMTVWNARLELALALGDAGKIDAILARMPAEAAGSGCGCGCGCGCGGPGSGCAAAALMARSRPSASTLT
jgi:hypothetical protein